MASRPGQGEPRSRDGGRGSALALVIAGGVAVALIGLAAPRLVSSLLVLWSSPAGDAAGNGDGIPDWAVALADDSTMAGQRADRLYRSVLALPEGDPSRAKALSAAIAASEAGLRLAPAQPASWLRLALLREMAGEPKAAAAALRLSILSGNFVPELMEARLTLAARLLDDLSADTLALVYRQVRLTRSALPETFARLPGRQNMANLLYLAEEPPAAEK